MSLKISRILHAGYLFESNDHKIIFDPIFENPFSRNCFAFPSVEFDYEEIICLHLDAIFISHFHDDHCSLESLNFLNRETPVYLYCVFDELAAMIKQLGFTSVYRIQIDSPIQVGPFEVIPRKALDEDVDSIFHIKVDDLNILNVVDSWIAPSALKQLQQTARWDLILWPFQTMREIEVIAPSRAAPPSERLPEEWIEQLTSLNPKWIVPSSCQFILEDWSWYNQAFFPLSYRQFKKEIAEALPQTQVVRLNPSVSIELDNTKCEICAPLSWVHPVGNQDVDYIYNPHIIPTSTSEIAMRFEPLDELKTERVFRYCQQEICDIYNELDLAIDDYFHQPRDWRLSVYNHQGHPTHFYYRLKKSNLKPISETETRLAWTTEVPIFKLHAALENGESLTSMYVRVNDFVFDNKIEKEVCNADIVEDPLIRCLFTGRFGAYQTAQLGLLKRS